MFPLRALLGAFLLGAGTLVGAAAKAQYSPNCERNGRRDYCAVTFASATPSPGKEWFDDVTFADHSVYGVMRNESSCKKASEKVRTCNAKIKDRSSAKPIPAYYRGTYYEGGYKHEYVGKGIHITYYFLD
jgi:hypothetical protein